MKKYVLVFIAMCLLGCSQRVDVELQRLENQSFEVTYISSLDGAERYVSQHDFDSEIVQVTLNWILEHNSGWESLYHTPIGAGLFLRSDRFSVHVFENTMYLYGENGILMKESDGDFYSQLVDLVSESRD